MNDKRIISINEAVGRGYKEFWSFKGRYRVLKGSRASKKSKTTALNFIFRMMKYKGANLLVVRKTYRTLKDSCFAELKWAIDRLGVNEFWSLQASPLEMTYLPTGCKIYFRGLDDPLKITSITVAKGYLCWLWIEEAYEIGNEADFDILQESIRGFVGEGLFKQITLTFNPWNERHWIKKRFFDRGGSDKGNIQADEGKIIDVLENEVLAITTNYKINEWLDEADCRMFEDMKKNNPKRYKVAGLGQWGISEGLIFENWVEERFEFKDILKRDNTKAVFGLDFGYTNDPSAFFCGVVDSKENKIYVFDEIYKKALTNKMIYDEIFKMGFSKEKIRADCAEPKSIAELRELGLNGIRASKKGKDSINNGIQKIQGYELIIHPKCVNFINEISGYCWDKDSFGNSINYPCDSDNHLMDAMRYAMQDIDLEEFSFD